MKECKIMRQRYIVPIRKLEGDLFTKLRPILFVYSREEWTLRAQRLLLTIPGKKQVKLIILTKHSILQKQIELHQMKVLWGKHSSIENVQKIIGCKFGVEFQVTMFYFITTTQILNMMPPRHQIKYLGTVNEYSKCLD